MRLSVGSMVSTTQKENALLLFHLLGKIMYNKRSIVLLSFRCHNTQNLRRQRRPSFQVCLCKRHLTRTCARPNTERSTTTLPVVGHGGAKNESSRCQCPLSLYDDYSPISLKVHVQLLYASTPVDASLFGLYVHQNYTQYCSNIEQCSSLIDNLSWTDANNSENASIFFLLTFIHVGC